MAVTSWIRRQFKDGVSTTDTLPAGAGAAATSMTLASGSSFPDGSVGPFIITIDQGLAAEEKVLIQSRSGAVLTVAANGRGYNGTAAQAHAANAAVLHTIDAQDLDEANQVANQTLGAIVASGDLLQGSGANALARLARGPVASFLQAGASMLSWVGFGVGQSSVVGQISGDGTQSTPARSDHFHQGVFSLTSGSGISVTGGDGAGHGALTVATSTSSPLGTLANGFAQVTTAQGSITTTVDLTNLTVTVTVGSGRRIKITAQVTFSTSVTGDTALLAIVEGATTLQVSETFLGAGGISEGTTAIVVLTPTAGSHTYKLQAQRSNGTGTLSATMTATAPGFILVEDIGT